MAVGRSAEEGGFEEAREMSPKGKREEYINLRIHQKKTIMKNAEKRSCGNRRERKKGSNHAGTDQRH